MRSFNLPTGDAVMFFARLVKITRLDGTVLKIAEAETSIPVGADTFTPLDGCEISAVRHVLGGGMPSMEISFAHRNGGTIDTADVYNGIWDGAQVVLYVVDRNNLTTLGDPLFTGSIQPVTLDIVGMGSFDIRGLGAKAEGFIQTYQPMCRTDLFSELCQLNSASHAQVGTIGTISNYFNTTILGLSPAPVDDHFAQGVGLTQSGVKFEIARWRQTSLILTTYLPICFLFTAGETVTLYPGCDKTTGAGGCGKFSNFINFQGEPHFLGAAAVSGS